MSTNPIQSTDDAKSSASVSKSIIEKAPLTKVSSEVKQDLQTVNRPTTPGFIQTMKLLEPNAITLNSGIETGGLSEEPGLTIDPSQRRIEDVPAVAPGS
jgi:hypothetical protein